MDPFTLALAVVAALSEILPLLGCTRANGLLHAIKNLFIQFHAESDCHIDLDVATSTQAPAAAGGADGPATIAALAETPP
jgi:hypothetical protein